MTEDKSSFKYPSCGQVLTVPADMAWKGVKCPGGAEMVIPSQAPGKDAGAARGGWLNPLPAPSSGGNVPAGWDAGDPDEKQSERNEEGIREGRERGAREAQEVCEPECLAREEEREALKLRADEVRRYGAIQAAGNAKPWKTPLEREREQREEFGLNERHNLSINAALPILESLSSIALASYVIGAILA